MSIILKSKFTRISLDHLFALELRSMFPRLYSCMLLFIPPDPPPLVKKRTLGELISWQEIFQRKQELRPDLRYIINTKNFTSDIINEYDPYFNPFSLTWTEIWEYDSWDSAIEGYNQFFTVEIINLLTNYCMLTKNDFDTAFYSNEKIIEVERSLFKITHEKR